MDRHAQDYAADISALAPIVIDSSRGKLLGFLTGCLVFLAAGVWMLGDPDVERWIAWLCILLFGAGTLVFIAALFRPPTLHLDREGFEVHGLKRGRKEMWADVDSFAVQRVGQTKQLMYTMMREPSSKAEAAGMAMTGRRGSIAGAFALSGPELAALMQAYRDAAVPAGRR